MFPKKLLNKVEEAGIIAVLVIDEADDAVPTARALVEGGVTAMELTLRTPAAVEALKRIKQEVPEMLAGVGTVINPEQVDAIVEAGADFGVAPGLNPRILDKAREAGLPFAPGVMTPSEIELAVEKGCRLLKFFPSHPMGGIDFLRSMNSPYSYLALTYIPLGGINPANLGSYLQVPIISAVGGSWIAKRDLIKNHKWDVIKENARNAVRIKQKARGGSAWKAV
jgi:2-dehydro-3-deoxyphosphogluconate aldolase / (4S)-4-hydroxy-2-oxoglutarate aldolase